MVGTWCHSFLHHRNRNDRRCCCSRGMCGSSLILTAKGLPLAVTISLSYCMHQMMKDQNLVRSLNSCETMGGATQICSDKTGLFTSSILTIETGTLTQNRMTVVKLKIGDLEIDHEPTSKDAKRINKKTLKLLTEGICVNTTAYVTMKDSKKPVFIGQKTECAILVLSNSFGVDYEKVRENAKILNLFPFSSEVKRMSTVIATKNGSRYLVRFSYSDEKGSTPKEPRK